MSESPSIRSRLALSPGFRLSELFSFEFWLLLFLFSGELKNIPGYLHLSDLVLPAAIDPAALILAVNVLIVAGIVARRLAGRQRMSVKRKKIGYGLIVCILVLYILIRYLPFAGEFRPDRKTLEFVTINVWCLLSTLLVVDRPYRVSRLLKFFILFGVLFIGVAYYRAIVGAGIFSTVGSFGETTGAFGEGYHRLGRSSGALILIAIVVQWYRRYSEKSTAGPILLGIFGVLGLFLSAQKAPVIMVPATLALIVGVKTLRGFKFSWITGAVRITLVIGVIIAVGVYLYTQFGGRELFLLQRLSGIGEAAGTIFRLQFWERSLEVASDHLIFGVGFGRFSVATGIGFWRHPHNLVIEVLLELGLVGLCLTAFVYGYGVVRNVNVRDCVPVLVEVLFWYYLANAMVSGSMTDNRLVPLFAAVLVVGTAHSWWRESTSGPTRVVEAGRS